MTFGNGMVIREPILDINDELRRLAWCAIGSMMEQGMAAMKATLDRLGGC
ncbi:MAG: hypothetical protein SFV54_14915 [Bryobacteraceae bacterium]|nr:hypothetical protein [Bryobacteraceae bacterium]